MALSFQSKDTEGGSGHSSWSQVRNLLKILVRIYKVRFGTTLNMQRTHGDQRTSFLHYHLLDRTAAQAHHQLKEVHGSEAHSRKTCCRWFKKSGNGNHSPKELPRSRAPVVHNRARILRVVEANPKNDARKWPAETDTSRKVVRHVLPENDKNRKRSVRLKKLVDTCIL